MIQQGKKKEATGPYNYNYNYILSLHNLLNRDRILYPDAPASICSSCWSEIRSWRLRFRAAVLLIQHTLLEYHTVNRVIYSIFTNPQVLTLRPQKDKKKIFYTPKPKIYIYIISGFELTPNNKSEKVTNFTALHEQVCHSDGFDVCPDLVIIPPSCRNPASPPAEFGAPGL